MEVMELACGTCQIQWSLIDPDVESAGELSVRIRILPTVRYASAQSITQSVVNDVDIADSMLEIVAQNVIDVRIRAGEYRTRADGTFLR